MKHVDFEAVRNHALIRLEKYLSPFLYYHSIRHTRDDVLPGATRLGRMARLSENDLLLLRSAAVYHDLGYIEDYQGHETISARFATAELPEFGYSPEQVQQVASIILATQMPQNPQTKLEAFMCDADLDVLGRQDFFVTSQLLRLEMQAFGAEISIKAWYTQQLEFLESHAYFTSEAQTLRNPGKAKNMQQLRELLNP